MSKECYNCTSEMIWVEALKKYVCYDCGGMCEDPKYPYKSQCTASGNHHYSLASKGKCLRCGEPYIKKE